MANMKIKHHFTVERDRAPREKGYWEAKHATSNQTFRGEDLKKVCELVKDWLRNNGGGRITIKDSQGNYLPAHIVRPDVEPTNLFS